MAIAPLPNGPIDEYLKATGRTLEHFNAQLLMSEPAATSIFAAEMIVNAIVNLTTTVEAQRRENPEQPA